jgi:hypothetical protein
MPWGKKTDVQLLEESEQSRASILIREAEDRARRQMERRLRKNQVREVRPPAEGDLLHLHTTDNRILRGRLVLSPSGWYLVEADETGRFLADQKAAEDFQESNTSKDSSTNPSRITNERSGPNTT